MTDPTNLPGYAAALQNAIDRAARDRDGCFTVYSDGAAIYVRDSAALRPPHATVVHVVQFWSSTPTGVTVQVRSAGARSEFVTR